MKSCPFPLEGQVPGRCRAARRQVETQFDLTEGEKLGSPAIAEKRMVKVFKGNPKKWRRMTAKIFLGRRGHSASQKKLPSYAATLP